jgi:methylated-DNA-protein-cysteine methyltransferase-like protein
MDKPSPLFLRTIALIKAIPRSKISTYSEISNLIKAPGCARHVSYILSSSSSKYDLPWHRVLNAKGKISLKVGSGYFEQQRALEFEKIAVVDGGVDLERYLWRPTAKEVNTILKGLPKHIPLAAR